MRLGTCIAFEIVVGLSALAGLSLGTAYAFGELSAAGASVHVRADEWHPAPVAPAPRAPVRHVPPAAPVAPVVASPVAPAVASPVALAPVALAPVAPAPVESAPVAAPVADAAEPGWAFVGTPDETLLAPIRTGTVKRVKFNRGGSTLSLRLDFDNGARAAFKPDQVVLQLPRREVAAYRLDRLLGIGRVPPAIARTFALDDLIAAVDPSQRFEIPRLRKDAVRRRGQVRGELSWWIPVISDVYIGGARLDETDAIVTWRRWLRVGAKVPADRVGLAHQLSTMTLFDFLTDNLDRWSGNNSKTSKDGAVLYFMDNTLSFGRSPHGSYRTRLYLERCQVFSRGVITRLRALDEAALRGALARDPGPYDPLLTDAEQKAVLGRRAEALAYVDGLIARYGEAQVLAFP